QAKILRHADRSASRELQAVLENRLFDLRAYAVRMRRFCAGHPVEKPLGTKSLEIPADFVELLTGIPHHLAGLGYVSKVLGNLEQAELATCYFLVCGHGVFP